MVGEVGDSAVSFFSALKVYYFAWYSCPALRCHFHMVVLVGLVALEGLVALDDLVDL